MPRALCLRGTDPGLAACWVRREAWQQKCPAFKIGGMQVPINPLDGSQEVVEPGEAPMDDLVAQRAALEDLAGQLAARGLCAPAIFVLESMRPISFVTAEFLVFLAPFARLFLDPQRYRLVTEALHDRANLAWLVDRLEQLEEESRRPDSAHKGDEKPDSGAHEADQQDERPEA